MSAFDNLTQSQKIRATIHRDVRLICTETCHFLGMDITKPAMEIVAELVYKKMSVYATDLEAFAKHAKRTTISTEDVKLLVRRNPSLKAHLNKIGPNSPCSKGKRRKTVALPVARQLETPSTSKSPEQAVTNLETPLREELMENMAVDDKRRKTVALPVARQLETPSTSKSLGQTVTKLESLVKEVFMENMAVDDTVDLTFD